MYVKRLTVNRLSYPKTLINRRLKCTALEETVYEEVKDLFFLINCATSSETVIVLTQAIMFGAIAFLIIMVAAIILVSLCEEGRVSYGSVY